MAYPFEREKRPDEIDRFNADLERSSEAYSDGRTFTSLVSADLFIDPEEETIAAVEIAELVLDGLARPRPGKEPTHLDVTKRHDIYRVSFTRGNYRYGIWHGYMTNALTGKQDRVTAGVSKASGTQGVVLDGLLMPGDFYMQSAGADVLTRGDAKKGYISRGSVTDDELLGMDTDSSKDGPTKARKLVTEAFNALLIPPRPARK